MRKGSHHTIEVKEKIREAHKGKHFTKEHREKIRETRKGQSSGMKDKHHTEETKRKIREGNQGRCFTEETRTKMREAKENYIPWNKGTTGIYSKETLLKMREVNLGKHHTKEAREKMSEARKGKKHWNWRGGITPLRTIIRMSIKYRLWREAVFERDNWICQTCGKRGGSLHSHHIKTFAEYPELRFTVDNGLTLCRKCHMEGAHGRVLSECF